MSHPKPNTRICDHDQHANIKFKSDINKDQLNFLQKLLQELPSFFSFLFHYLNDITFHLTFRASTLYSMTNIIHQLFKFGISHATSLNTLRYTLSLDPKIHNSTKLNIKLLIWDLHF